MLLALILLLIMVYQLIAIGVEKDRLNELNAKIDVYKEMIQDSEETIEERQTYNWIVRRARQLGYYFDGDKLYEIK